MSTPGPPATLLDGLLEGTDVVIAGDDDGLGERAAELGARVHRFAADLLDEDAVTKEVAGLMGADVLVCDTGAVLRAGPGGPQGLADVVAGAFTLTRAILVGSFEPAGRGLALLVAPRPGDGAQAGAAAAALENLARTASVEWARLGVRVVVVRPRDVTTDAALADLVAHLASPAGAYYSGCVLDLGVAGLTGYPSASS